VGVLGAVVQALVPPVLRPAQQATHGGSVAGPFVRDDDPRLVPTLVDQAAEEGLGGLLVP
jgi:hypothetical protein